MLVNFSEDCFIILEPRETQLLKSYFFSVGYVNLTVQYPEVAMSSSLSQPSK